MIGIYNKDVAAPSDYNPSKPLSPPEENNNSIDGPNVQNILNDISRVNKNKSQVFER